jgi:2-desacetyl-2-hydroxyethyl bacteriochlorophyllide A dehydrogenase
MRGFRVVFPAPKVVELEEFEVDEVHAGRVGTRTLWSMISTGTESIALERRFAAGTTWDKWVQFPFQPGYSTISEVYDVGPGVDSVHVGDVVALRQSHASHHVVLADECSIVPVELRTADAAWFALASIAFRGAQAAAYRLGDDALIVGAGPVGQMSIRWARAAGLRSIVVVDPFESRIPLAIQGGATDAFALPLHEAITAIQANRDVPSVIVETTGTSHVLASALTMAPRHGRVVLLGATGFPDEQRLGYGFVQKGIHLIGAHDSLVQDGWTQDRVNQLFFSLALSGRFDLHGLITHSFQPGECKRAYSLILSERGSTMGVTFDWRNASD